MNNYWQILDLNDTASNKDIVEAWYKLLPQQQTEQLKLFVKAVLDPYYRQTLNSYPNLDQLLPAGFFDDTLEVGSFLHNINLFTTPVDKLLINIAKLNLDIANGNEVKKPLLVLLNTGSYSPIHIGHIQMMEQAKTALQNQYHVVAGYMSPSHDMYVSSKYSGSAAYHSEARINLCQEVLSQSSWLMVDPWEARHNIVSINFTDVIIRLKNYLKKYVNLDIEIGYVFGSDNAGFSWAFIDQGISVCFERPHYELQFNTVKNDQKLDSNRHFFMNHKNNIYSSNAIRQGQHSFLPEKIKKLYFDYQNCHYPVDSTIYLIRDDSYLCTSHLQNKIEAKQLNVHLEHFKHQLQQNIVKAFENYCHMQTHYLCIEQQNDYINSDIFKQQHIINVDLWTYQPQQYTLGISRIFNLADGQIYSHYLSHRPGLDAIDIQLSKIPAGQYTLIDDDIASGRTVTMIKQLLPSNVGINSLVALSQQSFHTIFGEQLNYQFHDILDLRDFLIGSLHGGLVVQLPDGNTGRIPYITPYISLVTRAKIPHTSYLKFNKAVIEMNLHFYKSLSYKFQIKDMDQFFINSCDYLGFDREMTLIDFCHFHLNNSNNSQNRNGL